MAATTNSLDRFIDALNRNRVYRSIVRHGFPDSNRNRSLAVFSNFFLHIHPVKVRLRAIAFTRTFYLGGLAAASYFILVVTGIFLMFYYHPSVPRAYEDMKDLQFVVYMGPFLRNLHRWAAHAMVALVFLHMIRVFFAGAYRPPREFNWVIGVMLLLVTILLSYTGYLLPWDQLAYWGVTVGTNMADAVPFVGEQTKFLLLGGHGVNENALLRFYVLHCVVLPLFLVMLLSVHIWRVRKDGGIYLGPPGGEVEEAAGVWAPARPAASVPPATAAVAADQRSGGGHLSQSSTRPQPPNPLPDGGARLQSTAVAPLAELKFGPTEGGGARLQSCDEPSRGGARLQSTAVAPLAELKFGPTERGGARLQAYLPGEPEASS